VKHFHVLEDHIIRIDYILIQNSNSISFVVLGYVKVYGHPLDFTFGKLR